MSCIYLCLHLQLIALNANNATLLDEIAGLKADLDAKSQALANAETLSAQLQSTQKENNEVCSLVFAQRIYVLKCFRLSQ